MNKIAQEVEVQVGHLVKGYYNISKVPDLKDINIMHWIMSPRIKGLPFLELKAVRDESGYILSMTFYSEAVLTLPDTTNNVYSIPRCALMYHWCQRTLSDSGSVSWFVMRSQQALLELLNNERLNLCI